MIIHEIDSAYWKEWELFHLPGGIAGFLLLHFPLLAVILYGLIEVHQVSRAGFLFSLIVGLGGIFAFAIHTYFIRKGRPEFRTPISCAILVAILVMSVLQLIVAINLHLGGAS